MSGEMWLLVVTVLFWAVGPYQTSGGLMKMEEVPPVTFTIPLATKEQCSAAMGPVVEAMEQTYADDRFYEIRGVMVRCAKLLTP